MRIFESLLFLSNIGLLLLLVFLQKGNRRIVLLSASAISAGLLSAHWIIEGYRLQLIFPYCFTSVMLAVATYNYFKPSVAPTVQGGRCGRVNMFITAMLIITAGLMYAFPVFSLPEPNGEYKVGTQTYHFVDGSRNEIFNGAGSGKRELMVQVWYPAQKVSGKPSPFIEDSPVLVHLSKSLGLPPVILKYLKYIPSNSFKDAQPSTANSSYPLVILNHGYKSSRIMHTSQAENLASHGYIVAAIDHTYSTIATVFPDGHTTTMKTDEYQIVQNDYRDKVGKVWTDDVVFTLDQFELINSGQFPSILKGKLDLAHIGILGHSFGGANAYDASHNPRIAAGIDLDGGLYNYHNTPSLEKPFMMVYSERTLEHFKKTLDNYIYTDEELKKMGATRAEIAEETRDNKIEIEHIRAVADKSGPVVYIENTRHYNFVDAQFLSPILKHIGLVGGINPRRASAITNAYILDFFDKHLKNKGGSIIDGTDQEYPEVKSAASIFEGKTK